MNPPADQPLTARRFRTLRDRAIIHLNIADFAVAVERALDSRLRQRPVIIAPEGAARAAVYDMSEEAYQAGVRKGMALRRALRRCRDALLLPPHTDRYERAMGALLKKTLPYSPRIETGEDDGHLFVDATGTSRLFGPPTDVAWRLRKQIRADLDLDPIWSLASNKLVAKVATRIVKPDGEYVVAPGEEGAFLAPLPIWLMPGLETADLARLRELNLRRIAQVTTLSLDHLSVLFGKRARFLYEIMRGIDPSPVLPVGKKRPLLRVDHEFGNDTNHGPRLEGVLYRLVEQMGSTLRQRRLAAGRLRIVLDYSDGKRRVRQKRLQPARADDLALFQQARAIFWSAGSRRVRIRHLRLMCDRLTFPPAQMALFDQERRHTETRTRLTAAMDQIRQRFGPGAVQVGKALAA